jgi:hypothetical protein
MGSILRGLWVASLAAQVLLIGALIGRGLARRFPIFTVFLAFAVLSGVVLMQVDYRTVAYAETYRIFAFATVLLRLGVACELFERICQYFRGMGTFRFLIAGAGIGLSGLFAVVTFRPHLGAFLRFPQGLVIEIERWETEILAGLFIFTWLFLRLTVAHKPNFDLAVRRHWAIFTVYLTICSAASLGSILTVGREIPALSINIAMLSGDCLCYFAWLRTMHKSPPEREERVSEVEIAEAELRGRELLDVARWIGDAARR